jgi:predicted cobalt transporter CbtA
MIGTCLLFTVPELTTLAGAAMGQRQWSAAVFGVVNMALGIAFLAYLRRHWTSSDPASG